MSRLSGRPKLLVTDRLRSSGAAIVPRLSIIGMFVGAAGILTRDLLGRSAKAISGTWGEALLAGIVLVALALFGWMVLNIGIAVSVLIYLSLIWVLLRLRIDEHLPQPLRTWRPFVLAAGIGLVLYLLFEVGLGIYMPNTWLF